MCVVATWSICACFSIFDPIVHITGKDLDRRQLFLQLEIRPLYFARFELFRGRPNISAPEFPTAFAWNNTCHLSAYRGSIAGGEKWP